MKPKKFLSQAEFFIDNLDEIIFCKKVERIVNRVFYVIGACIVLYAAVTFIIAFTKGGAL